MFNFLVVFTVIVFIITVISILKTKTLEKLLKSPEMFNSPISIDTREKDIELIDIYLNRCFLKVLQEYLSKEFDFSDTSPVKKFISGRYCDLIQYLLRPDITFEFSFDDGKQIKRSFFETFIEKVYLSFMAETPENIKRLILKYNSGYTIETYYLAKRPKPSMLPFITESVRNKLWLRYTENEMNSQYMLQAARSRNDGSETDIKYQSVISNYDAECVQKISSDIYNSYEHGNKTMVSSQNTKHQSNHVESSKNSSGFEVDFSVKPGEGEQK